MVRRPGGWRARSADETPYLAQVRAALARAGTSAPSVNGLAQSVGTDAKGIALSIKRLVDRGEALKVTSELYVDAAAMGALEAALVQWLKEKGTIDAQGFKELSGLSRKCIEFLSDKKSLSPCVRRRGYQDEARPSLAQKRYGKIGGNGRSRLARAGVRSELDRVEI